MKFKGLLALIVEAGTSTDDMCIKPADLAEIDTRNTQVSAEQELPVAA